LPGQAHPVHYHIKKEEPFNVIYGDVSIVLNDSENKYAAGDMVIIERRSKHGFSSKNGAILEEISTTHYTEDSFYEDEEINKNKQRKTQMTFWADWLYRPIV
jgi:N-acetylneuraminate synthase